MKYGYPQQEEWARIRGERKPIEVAPVCFSKEFEPLVKWATGLGGKCEVYGSTCRCESSRSVIRDSRPLTGEFRGDGGFTRKIAVGFARDGERACKGSDAERREMHLRMNTQDNWGYEFHIRWSCSFS
jgi:hypothetical protein